MPGSVLAPPARHPASPERAARLTLPAALVVVVVAGMALSAWHAHDGTTWLLETVWVIVGLPVVVLSRRRFP